MSRHPSKSLRYSHKSGPGFLLRLVDSGWTLHLPVNIMRHAQSGAHGRCRGFCLLKEFREFAMRGNVVDLAVGIIIGAAFGAIVTSLVADIIMPISVT